MAGGSEVLGSVKRANMLWWRGDPEDGILGDEPCLGAGQELQEGVSDGAAPECDAVWHYSAPGEAAASGALDGARPTPGPEAQKLEVRSSSCDAWKKNRKLAAG
jgi:hypothetical protein